MRDRKEDKGILKNFIPKSIKMDILGTKIIKSWYWFVNKKICKKNDFYSGNTTIIHLWALHSFIYHKLNLLNCIITIIRLYGFYIMKMTHLEDVRKWKSNVLSNINKKLTYTIENWFFFFFFLVSHQLISMSLSCLCIFHNIASKFILE